MKKSKAERMKIGRDYLTETKWAVDHTFDLIAKHSRLLKELVKLSAPSVAVDTKEGAERLAWEKFRKNRVRIRSIGKKWQTQEFSASIMAGGILQIAKQGISIVFGGKPDPPCGRSIREVNLSDLIWAARNQAQHFEEGNFNSHTRDVFEKLATNHDYGAVRDAAFDLKNHIWEKKSLASNIISLLGWTSYKNYRDDMIEISIGDD